MDARAGESRSKKMNGPIVQNIALCLYENAYRNGEIITDFFNNSTAQFCKKIKFIQLKKLYGKIEEKLLYNNPNIFFKELNSPWE